MSSRVLAGPAAEQVQPMPWRAVGPPEGLLAPEGNQPGALSSATAGELQARLAALEQEARHRERDAHEAGLRQGRTQGAAEAQAALEPVLERLGHAVEEVINQRRRLRREAEEDVLKLALAISRRVLHRELSIDPEALLGVVKAALQTLEGRETHRLRLHSDHADMVRKHFEQLGRLERIEVLADSRLECGAVIFETARGNLDASIETQLQEIQRGLSDRLHRATA